MHNAPPNPQDANNADAAARPDVPQDAVPQDAVPPQINAALLRPLRTVGEAEGQNRVSLVGLYGSDLTHALSAWTSTSRDLPDAKRARVASLLARLMRDGHHTPFEKSLLHFLVLVDDATHIHLLKHRIGVQINAQSARYAELRDDNAYIPQDWPPEAQERLRAHYDRAFALYHATLAELRAADPKRAKESARYFLPKGAQLWLDISFNWRSFLHFLSLRDTTHAQREVREVAQRMFDLVAASGRFPWTCKVARAYLGLHSLFYRALSAIDLLCDVLPDRAEFFYDPKQDAADADGPDDNHGPAAEKERHP